MATKAVTKTAAAKTPAKRRAPSKRKGLGLGNFKVPVVGAVPVSAIAAGILADRMGEQVRTWISGLAPTSPAVQAIAGAPQYAIPLIVGYLDKQPALMGYGLAGVTSRVLATVGAIGAGGP